MAQFIPLPYQREEKEATFPDGNDLYNCDPKYCELVEKRICFDEKLFGLQQNLLNWYPFKKDCSILEIGGGCGTLTGMLCQRAAHVTSCEFTLKHAQIIFERHKENDNLEVCVGNFMKARFDRQYDYVVVNGVLEYARGIMGVADGDPFVAFLKKAKSFLKSNGKILLAIENRLGMKYLSGAPEDHIGEIFSGINGYPKDSYVKTFSKQELQDLFTKAQLPVSHWYYPYPDYKFPVEIFTDDSVNQILPSAEDIPFDMARAEIFDKKELYRTYMRNGITQYFSNSFFVELAETQEVNVALPTYIKVSNNRSSDFGVCTLLYKNDGFVVKKALYPQGWTHIQKMAENVCVQGDLAVISTVYKDGSVSTPFLTEPNLRMLMEACLNAGENERIWSYLQRLRASLYGAGEKALQKENAEFDFVFGTEKIVRELHWRKKLNIDLNVDNIFCGENEWKVIDNEWVFDFAIPAEFALWRMLYQLQELNGFSAVISTDDICRFLNISSEDIVTFKEWERHFAREYVGIRDLSVHYKSVYKIRMNDVLEREKKKHTIISHLFLFLEDGSIETLEAYAKNKDGKWIARFASEKIKDAVSIRWDPLEGNACRITNIDVSGLAVLACNADSEEPDFTFATFDPQFNLMGNWNNLCEIEIRFQCELLDWTRGYFNLEKKVQYLEAKVQHLESELRCMKQKADCSEKRMLRKEK